MGLPNIEVLFKSLGVSAIQRSSRGIVAMILKDSATVQNPVYVYSVTDIPEGLSAANKEQIQLALMGGTKAPKKVVLYVLPADATDYNEALQYLETERFDYLVVPFISSTDAQTIATWVKSMRDNKDKKIKAVLPHTADDHEGIINFTTDNIVTATKTYSTSEYCVRIAGILAGIPLTMSATFFVLPEVQDVPRLTKDELDQAIDNGELILFNDGEKVKIARAVNSLKTLTTGKNAEFKKIKVIDIMDMIHDDIKKTIEDNYIGKVANDYDNKCVLIAAIRAYLETLEREDLLADGQNTIDIDIDAQRNWLMANGYDVNSMDEQQIKQAATGSYVFLKGNIRILDAMEDITITFAL